MAHVLLLFITCFSTFLFSHETWSHLELGAGNYGSDGHTKASQAKTVLMQIKHISREKNYIDDLEAVGTGDYKPEDQYRLLFWTLDQLIDRYGDVGIFHVNDLCEEYAIYATQKLIEYAITKGYNSIVIEAISGDYQLIDSKKTLSKYEKKQYTSVHLKNPEVSFYHNRMDGDHFFSSEHARLQTRSRLQSLANLSENGLYLFILYHDSFIPIEERVEFMEKGFFYHKTLEWEAIPYIFPEGHIIGKEIGRVFYIENLE